MRALDNDCLDQEVPFLLLTFESFLRLVNKKNFNIN